MASSTLKPCAKNQTRNPDTNRCRNDTSTIPQADFAVTQDPQTNQSSIGWMAFAAVGALALFYALWEWRYELAKARDAILTKVRKS